MTDRSFLKDMVKHVVDIYISIYNVVIQKRPLVNTFLLFVVFGMISGIFGDNVFGNVSVFISNAWLAAFVIFGFCHITGVEIEPIETDTPEE